jgi:valyl-tRNA synthetase
MESQGRDIKLDEKRVEGYRNFATKLWNAARFLQGNGVGASQSIAAPEANLPVNRWIIGEVVETLARLDKAFAELRFDDMADAIYHFTWGTFCDWYVELVKGTFDEETRAVAAWAFDQILVMLHPFMPFVTEELWHSMGERKGPKGEPWPLITAKWPEPRAGIDAHAKAEVEWLVRLISDIREVRSEYGLWPGQVTTLHFGEEDVELRTRLFGYHDTLKRLARVTPMQMSPPDMPIPDALGGESIEAANERLAQSTRIQIPSGDATYYLYVGDEFDFEAERARLRRELETAEKLRDALKARLANPSFTERAKPEAVEKARADHGARAVEADRLAAALKRLG